MRVTLDTNVLIAAFISRGHSSEIVEYLSRGHTIVLSEFILSEFRRVLTNKFGFNESTVLRAETLIRSVSELVPIEPLERSVSRDPDDDNILATALAGQCDCLITRDQDLFDLQSYVGATILRPGQFWEFETRNR